MLSSFFIYPSSPPYGKITFKSIALPGRNRDLPPHFDILFQSPAGRKKLFQSDIANFQGASKEIVDFREQTGEEALWTNSMFGGMPAYQISVKYTGNMHQLF